tara:strand:- start:871 stop:2289 length:1419 start_codon:yes stop_codon:yes gene_type:complete
MLLSNLYKLFKFQKIYNLSEDKYFSSITANSKLINDRTIFIYDKNSKVKNKFLKEAIKNHTPAIISNKYFRNIKIPQFITNDLNKQIELILNNLYKNHPKKTIAVTGTNGKTSVTWYISEILNLLKYQNSSVGTLGHYINGKKINETNLTTPAYEELVKYGSYAKMNKNTFIFEASSHALDQNRIRNYPVNIAAITNISNDHLDYHKTISEYKKAKIKLFTNHLDRNGIAIINKRINNISSLTKKLINYGIKIKYFGKNYVFLENKNIFFNLKIKNNKYKIKNLKLVTDIELENLECAITCCLALNINEKKIVKILPNITNPPGRLQKLNYKKKKTKIVVDYAHTPNALERILKSLSTDNLKPVLVFGCGGQRDKSKRKLMGIVASKFASKVYITDDNPRNEDPSTIRQNIIKHCPGSIEIPDRKNAITQAIKDLKQNETLIIAGKGHEKTQIVKDKKLKFDDMKIVKGVIK